MTGTDSARHHEEADRTTPAYGLQDYLTKNLGTNEKEWVDEKTTWI